MNNYGLKHIDLELGKEYSREMKPGKIKKVTVLVAKQTDKAIQFQLDFVSPITRIGAYTELVWLPKSKVEFLDKDTVRLTNGPVALTFAKFSAVVAVTYGLEDFGCK